MMTHRNELAVPANLVDGRDYVEIIRVWTAAGMRQCNLQLGNREHPSFLAGILLQVVRHIAKVLHERDGRDEREILEELRQVIVSELG